MNSKKEIHTGKMPPQAIDLEEAVLGALMLEKDALITVLDIISPDSFYKESNKLIYEAIISLFNSSDPVDLLTVTNQLRKSGKLDAAGGPYNITTLTSSVSSAANIETHARIIAEKAIKRNVIRAASEAIKSAYEETTDSFEVLGGLESGILNISGGISIGKTHTADSLYFQTCERLENAGKKADGITGIPSGYYELDRITAGWQGSELIILAARPAMGKSDLALNLAINAAKHGVPTAIFSLEMSKEQLMDRFFAIVAEVNRNRIKRGKLLSSEWERIANIDKKITKNFMIADEPGLSTMGLRAQARRMKMKNNIGLIIVDYLQLMTSMVSGSTNDRISDISRTLKLVAKELNIPVIALSQLSREVEKRGGDKRPMLSDLRDSGAIEQDADIVLFPYRPDYYGITERDDGIDMKVLMEVDIAKNRSGGTATIDLKYLDEFGKVIPFEKTNGTQFPAATPPDYERNKSYNQIDSQAAFEAKNDVEPF